MSYYGVIFPEFWTGHTGRALRERGGKDAQLLGLYLASNRHANMLGLYHVLAADIRQDTGLSFKAMEKAFGALEETTFASFDRETAFVWVRQMARFRLGLHAGETLHPADKRVVAVNRLYAHLEMNPFLGAFYDVNRTLLCLRGRREGSPLEGASKGLARGFDGKGLTRGLQGAYKPETETETGSATGTGSVIRDQRSGSATVREGALPAAPDPNGAGPRAGDHSQQRRRVAPDARVARGASAPVVRGNGKDEHPLVTKYFGKVGKA